MSAFETFVQIELPKRPFLETDVAQETVLVRRGPGPRQLGAVDLAEGEVLIKLGGVLVGATVSSLGFNKLTVPVAVAVDTWTITHGFASTDAMVQVFNEDGEVMLADSTKIVDGSTIEVTFNTPQAGTARIIFLS